MPRTTIAQQMRGVEIKPGTCVKRVDHNTVRYVAPNGDIVYRLYMTDIVRIGHDVVTLRTNGWNTPTTFDRINRYAPMGWRVSNQRGEPMIGSWRDGFQPFEDGMQIIDGKLPPCHDNPWLRREIKALIRRLVDHAESVGFQACRADHSCTVAGMWAKRYEYGRRHRLGWCVAAFHPVLAQAAIPEELSTRWRAIQRLGGTSPALRAKLRKRVREALMHLFEGFQP